MELCSKIPFNTLSTTSRHLARTEHDFYIVGSWSKPVPKDGFKTMAENMESWTPRTNT